MLENLKSYTTGRELLMKSWILEMLLLERQFNCSNRHLLLAEVDLRLQRAHLSRWSSGEHGQSSLNDTGLIEPRGRLRDVEMDLTNFQRSRGRDEMECMAERLANVERQMAKMEEERAQERLRMAEQESERKRAMKEQRAIERLELAKRELEREMETDRRIMLLKKEREENKRMMERMFRLMEALRDEQDRMKTRQTTLVRVVEKMDAWIRMRDDSILEMTETAITQMEDRVDQIEDKVASICTDDCMVKLETFFNKKVSDIQKHYSDQFLKIIDQIDKSFKESTNCCLIKANRAHEPESPLKGGDGDGRLERLSLDRGGAPRVREVRGDKSQRPRSRRRPDREPLLSSTESSSTAGWTSEEGPSRAVGERRVSRKGKEKNKRRGFFSCLFKGSKR